VTDDLKAVSTHNVFVQAPDLVRAEFDYIAGLDIDQVIMMPAIRRLVSCPAATSTSTAKSCSQVCV
jgi:hypothetical protein